jgi:hypothetical protein
MDADLKWLNIKDQVGNLIFSDISILTSILTDDQYKPLHLSRKLREELERSLTDILVNNPDIKLHEKLEEFNTEQQEVKEFFDTISEFPDLNNTLTTMEELINKCGGNQYITLHKLQCILMKKLTHILDWFSGYMIDKLTNFASLNRDDQYDAIGRYDDEESILTSNLFDDFEIAKDQIIDSDYDDLCDCIQNLIDYIMLNKRFNIRKLYDDIRNSDY